MWRRERTGVSSEWHAARRESRTRWRCGLFGISASVPPDPDSYGLKSMDPEVRPMPVGYARDRLYPMSLADALQPPMTAKTSRPMPIRVSLFRGSSLPSRDRHGSGGRRASRAWRYVLEARPPMPPSRVRW